MRKRATGLVMSRAIPLFRAMQVKIDRINQVMRETLATERMGVVEYVSIADRQSLTERDSVTADGALASMAVRIGKTRLIDNVILGA